MIDIALTTVEDMAADSALPGVLAAYAEESAIKELQAAGPGPDIESYRRLEASGALRCMSARQDGMLIGFAFVLIAVLPHFGVKTASMESLFILKSHRKHGAGLALMRFAESVARASGAAGLLVSAPVGGRLERILPGVGYQATNRVFYKPL